MSLPLRVQKVLDATLRKYTPAYDTVYKRVSTGTGDALIGKVTYTYVDTKLDPQPLYARPKRAEVGGFHRYKMIQDDGYREPAVELILFCSSTAVSIAELENKNLSFTLVSPGKGSPEVYEIFDYDYLAVQGVIYGWRIGIRSVQR